jgi:hypothetical protein
MRIIFLLILTSLVGACSGLQRSQQSGYAGNRDLTQPENLREDQDSLEYKRTAYELGFDPTTSLSEDQLQAIDDRRKLRILERRLETEGEKAQYSRVMPWLDSDKERIEFLAIPTVEGRQSWIQQRNVMARSTKPKVGMRAALEEGDITIGMPQDFVRKAWGDPQDKEVSGNPLYKNERWTYTRYITSGDGFKKETRVVYFEGGKVVGWETQ